RPPISAPFPYTTLFRSVIDEKEGALGVVENFYEFPQQDVLAMRYKGQEVLLPVVDELVSHADMEAKQLFVNMPEGLLDIYMNPRSEEHTSELQSLAYLV